MSVRRGKRFTIVALLALVAGANSFAADVQTDCPKTSMVGKPCTQTGDCGLIDGKYAAQCFYGKCGPGGVIPDQACVQSIQNAIQQCNANKGKRPECDAQCDYYVNKAHIGESKLAANILACFSSAALTVSGSISGNWKDLAGQATGFRSTIVDAEASVEKQKTVAREKKDFVMMNCVDDKLQKIRGLRKLAYDSLANLAKAADREAAGHEVKRLEIISQKVNELQLEAAKCVGSEASYVGDTTVGLEIDPNIPNDDPTEPPLPLPDVNRPPSASPFE